MTFTFEIIYKERVISKSKYKTKYLVRAGGTFTNTSGSTGGDIHPKIATIKVVQLTGNANLQHSGAITTAGSGLTLTSAADMDGWWTMEGYE